MAPRPSGLCVVSPEVWCHSGFVHCCSSRGPEFMLCFLIAVCLLLWCTFYSSFPEKKKKIFGNEFSKVWPNWVDGCRDRLTRRDDDSGGSFVVEGFSKISLAEISPSLKPSIFPEKTLPSTSREYSRNVGVVDLKDGSVQWTSFSHKMFSSVLRPLTCPVSDCWARVFGE